MAPMDGRQSRMWRWFTIVVLALGLAAPSCASALTITSANGYGRLIFSTEHPIVKLADGVLVLHFAHRPHFSAKAIMRRLPLYISDAHAGPHGKTFRFALTRPVWLHQSSSGNLFAVDLVPASFTGTPPSLPPPAPVVPKPVNIATLPVLPIRAGAYAHFSRLVFVLKAPVTYSVFPGADHITIHFDAKLRPDFTALKTVAPPWVKAAGWHIDGTGTVIDFNTMSGSGYHDFRSGADVVLDILAPRSDAQSYDPPGLTGAAEKNKIHWLPRDQKNGATQTGSQRRAVLNAVAAIDGKTAPKEIVPLPTPRPHRAKTATGTTSSLPVTASASSATLHFPAGTAIAAFVREDNAWIVLSSAKPLDVSYLTKALSGFSNAVAVSSQDGVSVVRIALRQPERLRVTGDGVTNVVRIAPSFTTPSIARPLRITRDIDTPDAAALRAALPDAQSPLQLSDPVAGDRLIVVPAAPGRVLRRADHYVDFAALPSASGLVISPFAEDLDVRSEGDHVRISRPGGLRLTAAGIPAVANPAALTQIANGPTYINFAAWSDPMNRDVLTTERALRDAAAALPSAQANGARRQEAQFYIANRLDAEALGVVGQMQSSDPTLQDDPELQTIKAAADVMMARYRDARSALSATAFANDPHAAIWRGLADAGLQRWPQARHALMLAMRVIGRYPPSWQARVRIAYAHAAIVGHALGVAQKVLAGLPKKLHPPLSYDAELVQAQLAVAQGRYRAAAPLFAALKQCRDPKVAAHAIYDDTTAALAAGAISQNQAIASLEELRYRWRGDDLELKTLRKLGALYFAQKRWRKGLGVLQVAVDSFPNNESTRHVQDDMRKAFIALFLHGKADKMPPIQALGLFYDYIDLTPIGADGDTMIRRMANRLVDIDLLGPAEKLLKYQVDKRLNGVAQAQVAGRLAMVYLMDHKARHALAVLRATRVAGMPDDVAHARLLLEARALAALKQYAQALDLIAVEKGADTQRLRADIYWESGNWPMAGQEAEKLLGNAWSAKGNLSKMQRRYVMRAAIAYSLAGDATSLARLRSHFAPQMAQSPDAASFAVVTQNVSTQGVAFQDIAAKVASIDTLESFMKDFKKRFDAIPSVH